MPCRRFPIFPPVLLAAAALMLQPAPAAAQCRPAREPPSSEYRELVKRYVSADRVGAIRALGSGIDDRLRCDLDNLQAAAVAVGRGGKTEDRLVFERFSIRAAILLHADREIWDQFGPPVSEQEVACGTGPQAQVVERLTGILMLSDPEAKAFLSRFYVAMVRRAHWSHCLPQAELWARTGLKRLPKDATLLLTLGVVLDTIAYLTLVPAPRTPLMGPQAVRQMEAQNTKINRLWEAAQRAFEDALKADPSLHEARLRLGRVLWRLRRLEPARVCLQEVIEKSSDSTLVYLAHLFLGRLREDLDQLEKAEAEYRAALAIRPLSEPAAMGVSHSRLLRGDTEGARDVLASVIEQFPARTDIDPFKSYPMAHSREGQTILDELREKAVR